jgi:hypothetical protein
VVEKREMGEGVGRGRGVFRPLALCRPVCSEVGREASAKLFAQRHEKNDEH